MKYFFVNEAALINTCVFLTHSWEYEEADCVHCSTRFCIRDLRICGFVKTKERLQLRFQGVNVNSWTFDRLGSWHP